MRSKAWLGAAAAFALAVLYTPIAWMVMASFNAAPHGLRWQGFTLEWYGRILREEHVLEAMGNTLFLAVASTMLSTLLGTTLAIGMARRTGSRRTGSQRTGSRRTGRALALAVELPIFLPDILLAVGLLVAFRVLCTLSSAFELGMTTLVLGHVSFQISFVALTVRARLVSMGPELHEAAHDLYADDWHAFSRITLPLLVPAIVSGAMMAFILSLDDALISLFLRGLVRTVPTYILTEVKKGIAPQLHAVSSLFLATTLALVLGFERLMRPTMKGGEALS